MRRVLLVAVIGALGLLGAGYGWADAHALHEVTPEEAVVAAVQSGHTPSLPVWYRQYPVQPGSPASVACPSPRVCYVAGTGGMVERSTDGGTTWWRQSSAALQNLHIDAIACQSDSICLALASNESGSSRVLALETNDEGAVWRTGKSVAAVRTTGFACPRHGDCYALLDNRFYDVPVNGSRWIQRSLPLPATDMYADALACPAPGTCYVDTVEDRGNGYGAILATRDGGGTWRTHIISPKSSRGRFMGLSCADAQTCYVVTAAKTSGVLVTHDAWHLQTYHTITVMVQSPYGPGSGYYTQPVCPDPETCYLRSTGGTIAATTDGGLTWRAYPLDKPKTPNYAYLLPLGLEGMACPTLQQCVAIQSNGNLDRTRNSWSSWSTTFIGTARTLSGIACAGSETCFALGPDQSLLARRNGSAWTRQRYPETNGTLAAIACHGASLCIAAGSGGAIARTTTGGRSWQTTRLKVPGKNQVLLRAVACPGVAMCYVGGYAYEDGSPGPDEAVLYRTTNAGTSWAQEQLPAKTYTINAVACLSDSTCLAGGGDASDDDSYPSGSLLLTHDGGKSWHVIGTEAYFGMTCRASGCIVVGQSASRAPLAIRVSRTGTVLSRWQDSNQRFFRDSLNGVACTGATNCYAVGDGGLVAHTVGGKDWAATVLGIQQLTSITCPTSECLTAGSNSAILTTRAVSQPVPTATPPSTSGRPVPTPTAPPLRPTPTTMPAASGCPPACVAGMILYHADWSHGFDGWLSAGGGHGRWTIHTGMLVSPNITYQQPGTAILPPFQPGAHGINDYAVRFQARSVANGIGFHVSMRRHGGRYDDFAVDSCCGNDASLSIIYRDERSGAGGSDSIIGGAQMPPFLTRWHTFLFEVRGQSLHLYVDGRDMITGLDHHLMSGGTIDLSGQYASVQFRDFEIVAL